MVKNCRLPGCRAGFAWIALHPRAAGSSGLKGVLSAALPTKTDRELLILEVYGTVEFEMV